MRRESNAPYGCVSIVVGLASSAVNCERPEQDCEDQTEANAGGVIQRDPRADFEHGMNLRLAWG
jgi:hypothetical protein